MKVLEISTIMVELEDKGREARSAKSISLTTQTKNSIKRGHIQRLALGGNEKKVTSTSRLQGSKNNC